MKPDKAPTGGEPRDVAEEPWVRTVVARVAREIRRHGVILRTLGDVVVLMPPLSITSAELDLLVEATMAAVDAVTGAGSATPTGAA